MSPKTVFLVILVVILGFSNVESVSDTSPPGYNQGSNPQQQVPVLSEEQIRARDENYIQGVSNLLKEWRKSDDAFRSKQKPPQNDAEKKQRFDEKKHMDELELKVREQIENFYDTYHRKLPLNQEYMKKIELFRKEVLETVTVIQRLELKRAQEVREEDQQRISFIRKELDTRSKYERDIIALEASPPNQNFQNQREAQVNAFKIVGKAMQDSSQRLQDWHAKNQIINPEHEYLKNTLEQHYNGFKNLISIIDQRREQERKEELNQVSSLKRGLDTIRNTELDIRKKELPLSGTAFVERKKYEFTEDTLDKAIRDQIAVVEQRLNGKSIIDKEYRHQRNLLNERWDKLGNHRIYVKQRREEEASLRNVEKLQQQQQQQHQHVGQGIQNTKNGQHINNQGNRRTVNVG